MRYRKLDADGDYVMGQGSAQFLVDSPAAVAQAIQTRLGLLQGEWFLDLSEGLPLAQDILGYGTQGSRDLAIKDRILGTQGVDKIINYSSAFDGATRQFTVACNVSTVYGVVTVNYPL